MERLYYPQNGQRGVRLDMKFKYEWSMLFVTILWASNYVSAKIAMETLGIQFYKRKK